MVANPPRVAQQNRVRGGHVAELSEKAHRLARLPIRNSSGNQHRVACGDLLE